MPMTALAGPLNNESWETRSSVDECRHECRHRGPEPNYALSMVHRDFYTFTIQYERGLANGSATVVPGQLGTLGRWRFAVYCP